jgi:hypothetical protein
MKTRSSCESRKRPAKEQSSRERGLTPAQTPFEAALSLVLASGFLYRYECMSCAMANTTCRDIWKEKEAHFPEYANVEVHWTRTPEFKVGLPEWMAERDIGIEVLTSHAFLGQVFDRLNHLHVEAKATTPKKRAEAEASLLEWGKDIQIAHLKIFDTGIVIEMGLRKRCHFLVDRVRNYTTWHFPIDYGDGKKWSCNLKPDFTLNGRGFPSLPGHKDWSLYDGTPLWP